MVLCWRSAGSWRADRQLQLVHRAEEVLVSFSSSRQLDRGRLLGLVEVMKIESCSYDLGREGDRVRRRD